MFEVASAYSSVYIQSLSSVIFFFSENKLIWLGEGEGINDSLMFGSLFFFLIYFLALNVLFWCSTVWLAHLFIESMILI